jgi:hypothetical protein
MLGNHLDTMFTSNNQASQNQAKGNKRYNMMKAVSGSDWGNDKETLLMTFNCIVGSVFDFGAPVYFPNCKPTNVAKIQSVQNAGMHLTTGCHRATSISHLHAECKMIPVAKRLAMLSTQF